MNTSSQAKSRGHLVGRLIKPLITVVAVVLLIKLFVLDAYRIPSGSMQNTLVPGDFVLVSKLAYGLRTPHEIPFLSLRLSPVTLVSGGGVRRGDVVVFEFTKRPKGSHLQPGSKLVKRVIGLPGDTVLVAGSDVRVNGLSLALPHQPSGAAAGISRSLPWDGPIVVPRKGQVVQLAGADDATVEEIIRSEGHKVSRTLQGETLVDGTPAQSYTFGHDYYYVLGDNLGNSYDSRFWGLVSDSDLIGEVLMIYWSWRSDPSSRMLSTVSSIRWERIGTLVR